MRIKIINNISYQTYPITDDMIEINDNILAEIGKSKQFDANGNIIDYVDNAKKIAELKQQLADTDYKAIKYAEGLISDKEYKSIKEQRQAWRDEINQLERES